MLVVVAVEMQQAVNETKRKFVIERLRKTRGVFFRRFSADDDLAVLECDDIGRPRDLHELLVHARDFFVGNNRDLDVIEPRKRRVVFVIRRGARRMRRAFAQSDSRDFFQLREIKTNASLTIVNCDAHAK